MLTLEELKALVQTDLSDEALQVYLDDAKAEIILRFGEDAEDAARRKRVQLDLVKLGIEYRALKRFSTFLKSRGTTRRSFLTMSRSGRRFSRA